MEISKGAFLHPVPLLKIHDDGSFQGTTPLQFRKVNGSHDFFGSDLRWERGSEVTTFHAYRGWGTHRREREPAGCPVTGSGGVRGEQGLKGAASQPQPIATVWKCEASAAASSSF